MAAMPVLPSQSESGVADEEAYLCLVGNGRMVVIVVEFRV